MDSKNIFKRILYYMNPKHIEPKMVKPVSYTHLDVYKRQLLGVGAK